MPDKKMTKKEFYDKFGLKFQDLIEEYAFLSGLDKLYLEFTKEQALQIVEFFYDNADDIYNDAQAAAEQILKESAEKLKEAFKKLNEDEDEESLDKMAEA